MNRTAATILCAGITALCSCSSHAPDARSSPSPSLYAVEPWRAINANGGQVATASHKLYFTNATSPLVQHLPAFLDGASLHYANALANLPIAKTQYRTFITTTQNEYKLLATQHLGSDASAFVGIRRGGFSAGGIAIYMDIGLHDTLMLASHEGWHQYAQTTFTDPVPIWLDEGVATYMEGFRLDGTLGKPRFLPWANLERFDRLRLIVEANELTPLPTLLSQSPDELLKQSESRALDYYAQVWALIRFLHEYRDGAYAKSLSTMLEDAANGRYELVLRARLDAREYEIARATRRGSTTLQAYLARDLNSLDLEYREFTREITRIGARNNVVMGESPVR